MNVWRVYTDGGCKGNPGPGGWGVVVVVPDGSPPRELHGGEPETTNNRMELYAAIQGLERIPEGRLVQLWCDSKYVQDGIQYWINNWRHNGWKTSAGKPVKNADLWERLDAATSRHDEISWRWVKGHAGHPLNERADSLANRGIEEQLAALGPAEETKPQEPVRPAISEDRWLVFSGAAVGGTTGPGGWGFVALAPDRQPPQESAGGESETTFNRMELVAAIKALEATPEGEEVELLTSSDYLLDGIANWVRNWKRTGWRSANGKPVKNADLWQQIDKVCAVRQVVFTSVDDVDHEPGSKLARELARAAQRAQPLGSA